MMSDKQPTGLLSMLHFIVGPVFLYFILSATPATATFGVTDYRMYYGTKVGSRSGHNAHPAPETLYGP